MGMLLPRPYIHYTQNTFCKTIWLLHSYHSWHLLRLPQHLADLHRLTLDDLIASIQYGVHYRSPSLHSDDSIKRMNEGHDTSTVRPNTEATTIPRFLLFLLLQCLDRKILCQRSSAQTRRFTQSQTHRKRHQEFQVNPPASEGMEVKISTSGP